MGSWVPRFLLPRRGKRVSIFWYPGETGFVSTRQPGIGRKDLPQRAGLAYLLRQTIALLLEMLILSIRMCGSAWARKLKREIATRNLPRIRWTLNSCHWPRKVLSLCIPCQLIMGRRLLKGYLITLSLWSTTRQRIDCIFKK